MLQDLEVSFCVVFTVTCTNTLKYNFHLLGLESRGGGWWWFLPIIVFPFVFLCQLSLRTFQRKGMCIFKLLEKNTNSF